MVVWTRPEHSFSRKVRTLVPDIKPFPGIRYRADDTDLARLVAPPYDVISPALQEELYSRDPHNIVRVVLNRTVGDEAYAEAGDTLRGWIGEGVLQPEEAPSLYLLEQSFSVEGETHVRLGLLARFKAEDAEKGVILPHEQTRKAAKEDRWRLLQTTRANFSPIFLMFPDPENRFSQLVTETVESAPLARFTDDDGVAHRLWRVDSPEQIAQWQELLGDTPAYIADGHHRHATALRWRDETGPEGAWTLGYLTPIDAPGLLVLPYHRVLSEGPSLDEAENRLGEHFELTRVADARTAAQTVARSQARWAFALAEEGQGALVAEARPGAESLVPEGAPACLEALDTYFVHHAVLGPLLGISDDAVGYVHSQAEAEEALSRGQCRLALLLRGTPVQQIVDVSDAGENMPAKSTFFHPKLPSGLVTHPLVEAEG